MGANYVLLETITVGEAGASSVTFNNIPQTGYTDLKIVCSARTVSSGPQANMLLTLNGTTTAYYDKALAGNGSSASSFSDSNNSSMAAAYVNTSGTTTNTFGNYEVYIPNFTSSNYKSFSVDSVVENNATSAVAATLTAGLWQNTAAITSVSFAGGSNFVQYSTFSLYGLAAVGTTPVIAPYASGGDIIQTDGTYWYHAFLSSGTFTPAKGLSCDVLVVAGGGGGGYQQGAGAGAGGLLAFTSQGLASNTAQTVTIGAGGVGGTSSTKYGTNGGDSQFGSLTLVKGGGYGGASGAVSGNTGGSGGGAWVASSSSGGSATSGQGNAGGSSASGTTGAGGGGGAGAAGQTGQASYNGGAGGIGYYSTLTDGAGAVLNVGQLSSGHYYFAGGGGGGANGFGGSSSGAGGLGGGAAGTNSDTLPSAGTPNTGGGGAGGGQGSTAPVNGGSKGGAGIVIVRYTV